MRNVIIPQWHYEGDIRNPLTDKRFRQKGLFNRTQNIQTNEQSKGLLVPISFTFQRCTQESGPGSLDVC